MQQEQLPQLGSFCYSTGDSRLYWSILASHANLHLQQRCSCMFTPLSPLGPWKRTGTHKLAMLPPYPALVLKQKYSTDVNKFKQLVMSVRLMVVPCISSWSMATSCLLRPAHRYVSKPRCRYSLPPQWALSPRPLGFHVAHLLSVVSLRLAEHGWASSTLLTWFRLVEHW